MFGIFHFLASSILISQFFVESKVTAIIGLIISMLLYSIIKSNSDSILNNCYNSPLFCFVTGLGNTQYNSIDHFSILPYYMYVLVGILIGHLYFDKGNRRINLLENLNNSKKPNLIQKNRKKFNYNLHSTLVYSLLYS